MEIMTRARSKCLQRQATFGLVPPSFAFKGKGLLTTLFSHPRTYSMAPSISECSLTIQIWSEKNTDNIARGFCTMLSKFQRDVSCFDNSLHTSNKVTCIISRFLVEVSLKLVFCVVLWFKGHCKKSNIYHSDWKCYQNIYYQYDRINNEVESQTSLQKMVPVPTSSCAHVVVLLHSLKLLTASGQL